MDDLGLCEKCITKLERDLIRQRDWDYLAWACGLSDGGQKKLYQQVIAQYGKKLELIALPEGTRTQRQPPPFLRRGHSGTVAHWHSKTLAVVWDLSASIV